MLNTRKIAISILCLTAMTISCSKKKEETSAKANYSVVSVTGPVAGNSAQSLKAYSSGVSFTSGAVSASNEAYYSFQDGKNFIQQGKSGDGFSCLIRVLAQNGIITSDGTPTYFVFGTTQKMKMNAVYDKDKKLITSYGMQSCSNDGQSAMTQTGHIGSTLVNNSANVKFKLTMPSIGLSVAMDINGTFENGGWTSKTISQYFTSTGYNAKTEMTQTANSILSKSVVALSGTTFQLYSLFSLYGNSESTYSMGEGSTKMQVTTGSTTNYAVTKHWDDTLATATTSSHFSAVTDSVFMDIPSSSELTSAVAFTADETWDCNIASGVTPVDVSGVSQAIQTEINTCFGQDDSGSDPSGGTSDPGSSSGTGGTTDPGTTDPGTTTSPGSSSGTV